MSSPFTSFNKNFPSSTAALAASLFILVSTAAAFEGRITATSTQGGQSTALLYTVGTNALRLEVTGSDRPNPVDVLDRNSGKLTLLFQNNRSFVHFPKTTESASAPPPGFPPPPANLPPGIGPQTAAPAMPAPTPGAGSTNISGMPALPAGTNAEHTRHSRNATNAWPARNGRYACHARHADDAHAG